MLVPFLTVVSAAAPVPPGTPLEPDGSRPVGNLAPFHGEPVPPDWLRQRSHAAADPDCRHYIYEAYASAGHWLVRYVMLPEGDEAFRDIELVLLFARDGRETGPRAIPPAEIAFDPTGARWKSEAFRLVDRRELLRP